MIKVKDFIKEHKREIVVGGCFIAVGIILGVKINTKMNAKVITLGKSLRGKELISWNPQVGSIPLEKVKEVLELNANNNASYMVFRKGPDPNAYICVRMDNLLVIPQAV